MPSSFLSWQADLPGLTSNMTLNRMVLKKRVRYLYRTHLNSKITIAGCLTSNFGCTLSLKRGRCSSTGLILDAGCCYSFGKTTCLVMAFWFPHKYVCFGAGCQVYQNKRISAIFFSASFSATPRGQPPALPRQQSSTSRASRWLALHCCWLRVHKSSLVCLGHVTVYHGRFSASCSATPRGWPPGIPLNDAERPVFIWGQVLEPKKGKKRAETTS